MRHFLLTILYLALLLSPVTPVSADFAAYPELSAIDNHLYGLVEGIGAKLRGFKVSEPASYEAYKRYPFELEFTMSEPERLPELINKLEDLAAADLALRAIALSVSVTAESNRDGKVLVYVMLLGGAVQGPEAAKIARTFPTPALQGLFTSAKFEPAVQRGILNSEIGVWLTNLRISGDSGDIQLTGYSKDFNMFRSSADNLVSASVAGEVVLHSLNRNTYAKHPFQRFDCVVLQKARNPNPRAVLSGIDQILAACDQSSAVFSGIRVAPIIASEAGNEIPVEITFSSIDDAQWNVLKTALAGLKPEGSSLKFIGELQNAGGEGGKSLMLTLAIPN